MIAQRQFLMMLVFFAACSSCGKSVYSRRSLGEDEVPTVEEQPDPTPSVNASPTSAAIITDFLRSDLANKQTVRKDHGQVILSNSMGDIAIAGVTRSKIISPTPLEPSLAGDLFFTRYSPKKGWDETPIQVPVEAPTPTDPSATPLPLPDALLIVKGGRLLDSGKALIVGETTKTQFSQAQLNLDETKSATVNIFLTVFGAGESGMMRSVRMGLSGENIVAGAADGFGSNSLVVAGTTTSGLRRNQAQDVITETATHSNYVMELDAGGNIIRNLMWPTTDATISRITSNKSFVFIASNSADGKHVYVNGLRWHGKRDIVALPMREVCATASSSDRTIRASSLSVSETEVVVAVEIIDPSVAQGNVLPCFEVFQIRGNGLVVNKREQIFMPEFPSLKGTVHAQLVENDNVLLLRSRENSDSRGRTTAISTFLFSRPLLKEKYQSKFWSPSRPEDWYGTEDVNGVTRSIQGVVRSSHESHHGTIWVIANDRTNINGEWESLVNIGTYSTISKEAKP